MDTQRFYERIVESAPFPDRAEAERAVAVVFDELAQLLGETDARAIAEELPPDLGRHLSSADRTRPTASGFLSSVARGEHTNLGFAREHVSVVLQALIAQLSLEAAIRLRRRLPPEIAALAEPRERAPTPGQPVHHRPRSSPISTSRSGSSHPLSEARPDTKRIWEGDK